MVSNKTTTSPTFHFPLIPNFFPLTEKFKSIGIIFLNAFYLFITLIFLSHKAQGIFGLTNVCISLPWAEPEIGGLEIVDLLDEEAAGEDVASGLIQLHTHRPEAVQHDGDDHDDDLRQKLIYNEKYLYAINLENPNASAFLFDSKSTNEKIRIRIRANLFAKYFKHV